jgi:SAM-dependent methyltransferase
MHDATVQTSGIGVAFRCPRCQHDLRPTDHSVDCLGCNSSWPIADGIPRFDAAAHFGEAAPEKMTALTQSAAAGHWEEATRRHFGADAESLYRYIVDLNRASWISLLPIPASATVLDIGAGLGAITHALALTYRHVIAVEPVRERLEFIRVRVRQEALHNVQLVQTTAALLPFAPGTFDLIVVNGVLEWVGEWDQSVSPRKAQLRFLRRLRELLAPNGVVVIGIENRVSVSSFAGQPDHNGLRFTNLMPRAVATGYMKLRTSTSYRMNLNARREYRTYTYSRAGYRRLLVEAGYRTTDFWWADPGYNEPYFLCPLADTAEIHSYLKRAQQEIQCLNGPSLRGALKDWLVVRPGLFPAMVPDFVIIARGHEDDAQESHRDTSIVGTVLDALKEHAFAGPFHVSSLNSAQLGNKQTLKVAERDGTLAAVAKIARVDATTTTGVENGFAHLSAVWNVVRRTDPGFLASLPEPLRLFRVAGRVVSLERAVGGVSLEQLSMDPSFLRDRNRVRRHLELITDWIIRFQRSASSHLRDVVPRSARPEWMMGAGEPGEPRDLPTVQHGDLFPGNIFVDDAHGHVSVIDWDGLAVGYPPLFDYFCAVTQLVHPPRRSWRSRQVVVPYDEFLAFAFCEVNWFSALVLEWAKATCSALGFQASNLPGYFLQHLAVRHRQQSERGAALAPALDSLHRRILEGSTRSIFE